MVEQKEIKLTIELTPEQSEGYPVTTETLWFEEFNGLYRLINIPFFIDDLSLDDVVALQKVDKTTYKLQKIVTRSKNSTIWVTFSDESIATNVLKMIHSLGCGYEGGVLKGYFALNVPSSVDYEQILTILNEYELREELLSFQSSIR